MAVRAGNHIILWNYPPAKLSMLEEDEVHIWRAGLQLSAEEIRVFGQFLSPDEQARARRFHFRKDREHFIAARGILRSILARYLNTEPVRLRFEYSHYGKPSLRRAFGGDTFRFNLSHSQGLALYAFARGRELGVDIEFRRENFAAEKIAAEFFSPREVADLRSLPPSQRTEAFFHCWTRKEAYIKAIGEGLSMPLDEFDVSLFPEEPAAFLSNRTAPQEVLRWSLLTIDVDFEYVAAVAVEGHNWQPKCWSWKGL